MTANQTHKAWASAINSETWKKLTSSINIVDLDHIKSSHSQQSVDGIDETFQIRTPQKITYLCECLCRHYTLQAATAS